MSRSYLLTDEGCLLIVVDSIVSGQGMVLKQLFVLRNIVEVDAS